jgi:hypothetical protein
MNLKYAKKYKFIITSGCSYERHGAAALRRNPLALVPSDISQSSISDIKKLKVDNQDLNLILHWCTPYDYGENDYVVHLGVGHGGYDNRYINATTVHTVKFLLGIGIKPEQIYCLAQWSDYTRQSTWASAAPDIDFQSIFDEAEQYGPTFNYFSNQKVIYQDPIKNYIKNNIKITHCIYPRSWITQIGEELYIRPLFVYDNTFFKSKPEYKQLKEWENKIFKNLIPYKTNKQKYKQTLDFIKDTGDYLEANNISYNFTSMWNMFDNFMPGGEQYIPSIYKFVKSSGTIQHHSLGNHYEGFFGKPKKAEELMPSLTPQIEEVKKFNWTFYKTKHSNTGGYDEFCMEEYGNFAYADTRSGPFLGGHCAQPGAHPTPMMYPIIFEQFATNCKFLNLKKDYKDQLNTFKERFYNKNGYDYYDPVNYPIGTKDCYPLEFLWEIETRYLKKYIKKNRWTKKHFLF